jgi:hypothetical protein
MELTINTDDTLESIKRQIKIAKKGFKVGDWLVSDYISTLEPFKVVGISGGLINPTVLGGWSQISFIRYATAKEVSTYIHLYFDGYCWDILNDEKIKIYNTDKNCIIQDNLENTPHELQNIKFLK